jgi:hypothetical protein
MLEEKLKPLPKRIYDKALSLGVEKICLTLEGGNDEGILNAHCFVDATKFSKKSASDLDSLSQEVEDWFWENHDYSGAGDGGPYGDEIVIYLKENKVRISDWYTTRVDGEQSTEELKLEEEETEKEEAEETTS